MCSRPTRRVRPREAGYVKLADVFEANPDLGVADTSALAAALRSGGAGTDPAATHGRATDPGAALVFDAAGEGLRLRSLEERTRAAVEMQAPGDARAWTGAQTSSDTTFGTASLTPARVSCLGVVRGTSDPVENSAAVHSQHGKVGVGSANRRAATSYALSIARIHTHVQSNTLLRNAMA